MFKESQQCGPLLTGGLLLKKEKHMTERDLAFVQKCIQEDIHRFYTWSKWKAIREAVLKMDKQECQICKARGEYAKATTVHHVNYVKRHPEKALDIWYTFRGKRKRNLISLCRDCHEAVHSYRKTEKMKPLTEERWD